ncbi:succinate-acetate/proton symporter SatP [mine drainage metagenome]|jgi:succinate-acetate transporter protein|uniref:Succinate-acetate/proton symporter SatP n=1 Tax=mine drainage metagenome TaxID=410659 RepID=A0A1J5QF88_9ZZZZ
MMEKKAINPAPLGLSGFALTTWLLSMHNAGMATDAMVPAVLACAFAFGGTAQFIAGLFEAGAGNSFGFIAFCGYGAFWWSFGLLVEFFPKGLAYAGWYLLLWGVFTTFMWIATWKKGKALMLVFTALTPTFFLLAFGALLGIGALGQLGGYLGLLTAALAFYLAAAEVINEAWGRTVLPV